MNVFKSQDIILLSMLEFSWVEDSDLHLFWIKFQPGFLVIQATRTLILSWWTGTIVLFAMNSQTFYLGHFFQLAHQKMWKLPLSFWRMYSYLRISSSCRNDQPLDQIHHNQVQWPPGSAVCNNILGTTGRVTATLWNINCEPI